MSLPVAIVATAIRIGSEAWYLQRAADRFEDRVVLRNINAPRVVAGTAVLIGGVSQYFPISTPPKRQAGPVALHLPRLRRVRFGRGDLPRRYPITKWRSAKATPRRRGRPAKRRRFARV